MATKTANNPLARALAATFKLPRDQRRELAHCLRIAVGCELDLEPASIRRSTDRDVRKLFGLEAKA